MIRFERLPAFTKEEMPVITSLLEVFDTITFNSRAELIATFDHALPIVGPVIFSYFNGGNHLQVRRKVDDKAIFSDEITLPTTRLEILSIVMNELRKNMNGLVE